METLFIGQNIFRLKVVDSTNNYAAGLLRQSGSTERKKIFEGTLVIASFQEQGRGQRGNQWQSKDGENLTFSLILFPQFLKPSEQFFLNKIISLGVYDFLGSLHVKKIAIKWPNDIMVKGKKIAGILIENTLRSNEILSSVIGIGININQQNFEKIPNAISLRKIIGKKADLDKCLEKLCGFIESRYLQLKTNRTNIDKDYLNCLYQKNLTKKYKIKGIELVAEISGVTPAGFLILQKMNGEEIFCDFKEVEFL